MLPARRLLAVKLKAVDGLRSDEAGKLAGILKNLEAAIDRLGLTVMKASAKGVQHVAFVTLRRWLIDVLTM